LGVKTGAEYIESLGDGRATYYDGRRIDDLMAEPAFARPAEWVAEGYDRYYSDAEGAMNPMVLAPRSREELQERGKEIIELDVALNVTYQSIMTLLTASPRLRGLDPVYQDRIKTYVESAIADDIRICECITDAKGDRSKAPGKQPDPDAYVHVVDRTSDGVVVRGAKMHITSASLCHELMVLPTKAMKPGEEDYAIVCMIPLNAPGVKVANTSFHPLADDTRHYPISSRISMPDGTVLLDDVFVPYERVLLDGEASQAAVFAHSLGMWERLGGVTFMAQQADEIVGLAQLIAEANGLAGISHVREKIDELAIHATMVRAGLEAAVMHAEATPEGYYYPNELYTNAAKYHAASQFSHMVRHLHDIAGGAVLTAPTIADLENPDISADLNKYFQASQEYTGEERVRILHAIRDLTADRLGGWHHVTNLQSGGGLFAQRIVTRRHYDLGRAKAIAANLAGIAPRP
jgi:4-hydroxybutyryl-CoA dehydratase / vinylacetyl-CoA-Delta-isomerase